MQYIGNSSRSSKNALLILALAALTFAIGGCGGGGGGGSAPPAATVLPFVTIHGFLIDKNTQLPVGNRILRVVVNGTASNVLKTTTNSATGEFSIANVPTAGTTGFDIEEPGPPIVDDGFLANAVISGATVTPFDLGNVVVDFSSMPPPLPPI